MKKEVAKLIEESIDTDKFFVVDIHISPIQSLQRIKLTIDSDLGIGIDECSEISKDIVKLLDESQLLDNYELEVSSPGVGEPLKLERQYIKNVGRLLKISTTDNQILTGKLLSVLPGNKIVIEEKIKDKQKKINLKTTEILFADIKKAAVEVSFELNYNG